MNEWDGTERRHDRVDWSSMKERRREAQGLRQRLWLRTEEFRRSFANNDHPLGTAICFLIGHKRPGEEVPYSLRSKGARDRGLVPRRCRRCKTGLGSALTPGPA